MGRGAARAYLVPRGSAFVPSLLVGRATDAAWGWLRAARADAVAIAVQAAVFVPVSLHRFVDGDEGVYAFASRLAVHGKVPYRDFFYEQTPLLPYVYGAWLRLTGESWEAVRLLSVLLALATGTLLFRHVRLQVGLLPAAVALALYAVSGLVMGYFTIVKTFPLATVPMFGAYLLAHERRARAGRFAGAGLLLGLAVDARLVVVAAVPAFLVVSIRAGRTRALAAGLTVGLLPGFAFLALDPRAFFFDTLRYHALKDAGYVGDFHEKAQTAATLVGLEPTDRARGLQFLLLLVLCAAAAALPRFRSRAGFAFAIAASLGAASVLPTPTYVQYFSIVVPFLVVSSAELLRLARLRPAGLALGLGLCGYTVAAVFAVHNFTGDDPLLRPSIASGRQGRSESPSGLQSGRGRAERVARLPLRHTRGRAPGLHEPVRTRGGREDLGGVGA